MAVHRLVALLLVVAASLSQAQTIGSKVPLAAFLEKEVRTAAADEEGSSNTDGKGDAIRIRRRFPLHRRETREGTAKESSGLAAFPLISTTTAIKRRRLWRRFASNA